MFIKCEEIVKVSDKYFTCLFEKNLCYVYLPYVIVNFQMVKIITTTLAK